MSVAKAARRRGVAKQLHQVLIAHAQAHQLKGVFLSTSSLQVMCS
jgi:N-acetylglutamate synthase-like GNAT family acetyltransferase